MVRNDCIETIEVDSGSYRLSFTWKAWARAGVRLLRGDLARIIDLLMLWQRRSVDRQRLHDMDGRRLEDMGIGRIDALKEAAKPFWRD